MANKYQCECCGHTRYYENMIKSATTLCTFPKNDKFYCLEFGVPTEWLRKTLPKLEMKMSIKAFLDEYTWDMTYFVYEVAKSQGVILWHHNQE